MKQQNFRPLYVFKDGSWGYGTMLVAYLVLSLLVSVIIFAAGVTKITDVTGATWYYYVNGAVSGLVVLAVFLGFNKVRKINFVYAANLKIKPNWKAIVLIIAMSIVCLFGLNFIINLLNVGLNGISGTTDGDIPMNNIGLLIAGIFVFALLPAVAEELLFRGMIFKAISKKLKPAAAITVSALMFAMYHFSMYQLVYQFALGILFACIVYYTGSVIYSMIAHFLNNFLVILFTYTGVLGAITPVSWGIGSVLMAIGCAILGAALIVGLFYLLKKVHKKHSDPPQTVEYQQRLAAEIAVKEKGMTEYDKRASGAALSDKNSLLFVCLAAAAMWIILVVLAL